jgi:hypothetical protein
MVAAPSAGSRQLTLATANGKLAMRAVVPIEPIVEPDKPKKTRGRGRKKLVLPEPSPEVEESHEETESEHVQSEAESTEGDNQAYVHPFESHLTSEDADISNTTPDAVDKLRFEKARSLAEVCLIFKGSPRLLSPIFRRLTDTLNFFTSFLLVSRVLLNMSRKPHLHQKVELQDSLLLWQL